MSPLEAIAMKMLDKIIDLFLNAIKDQLVMPLSERRRVANRVKDATVMTLEPLLAYLQREGVHGEALERLMEACIQALSPLSRDPRQLLRASLDGAKVFEQLYPQDGRPQNLPETIREDGLESAFSLLLPGIADVLCKLVAQSKEWNHLSGSEILHRLDGLIDHLHQRVEKQLAEISQAAQRTEQAVQRVEQAAERTGQAVEHVEQGVQRIEQKQDLLLERVKPTPAPPLPVELPRRAEYFTGRQSELAKLLELLQPGHMPTLLGPGGIGKTALAAEALHVLLGDDPDLSQAYPQHGGKLKERFPDGLIYFPFYHQKGAEQCLEAICRAFGEQPLPTAQEAARRALAGRRLLLVLDGTEEADDLPAVLSVCAACGVLLTTRDRKDAPTKDIIEVETLPADEALWLLKALAGEYALDEDGKGDQAARAIIELTGRLSLAVYLAGKYLSQKHSAAEYLRWLQQAGLEALHHGERQRESVKVMLQHSLEQVPEAARTLLALSAAMSYAPFPLDLLWAGAPELKNETHKRRALDPLLEYGLLVQGSGIRGQETGDRGQGSGEMCQVAHLLLYEYARRELKLEPERLLDLGRYGVALAEREVPRGPAGFRFLDAYRPHLLWLQTHLLTLPLSAKAKGEEPALRLVRELADALLYYLYLDGRWAEWLASMQSALQAARLASDRYAEGAWLGNLGNAYDALGKYQQAIEHHQQALAIAQEIGDRQLEGNSLSNLGIAYMNLGQYAKAIEYYQQALAIDREIGDKRGEGIALGNLGNAYQSLGKYQQAIEHHQQALAIDREIGNKQGEGIHLSNLGSAYGSLGQYAKAIEHYQQALAIDREIGNKQGEGQDLGNLGVAYQSLGQYQQAIEYHQQALAIARQISNRAVEGTVLGNLGSAYGSLGQHDKAIEYFQPALAIAQEIGDRLAEGYHLTNLGMAHARLGEYDQAQAFWQQALQIYEELGVPEAEKLRTWLGMLAEESGKQKPSSSPAKEAPEEQEQGLSLEEWVSRSVRAAKQRLPEAAQWFELASKLAVTPSLPEEARKLAKVLRNILAGDTHPDLSSLPAELAELVRKALEE